MADLKSGKEFWDEAREKLKSEPPSGEELEQLRLALTEEIPQLMRQMFGPSRDWLGELQMARARSLIDEGTGGNVIEPNITVREAE
jgi:hypothetical protein